MSDQTPVHLELMREMGAERYEGFNPIAPRSHRWMMDADERVEETRAFGWVLWRCIDRDPEGKTGPPKKTRTAYAHDQRVAKKGHLETKHMAEDLGMTVANATDTLRRLAEKGKIRVDDGGRIWLRGDTPEPRRIKSKDDGEGSDDKEPVFFCTENCPEAIRLSFQKLDEERREQYVRLYREMPEPLAKHFETLDPAQRGLHTWQYLQAYEYGEQLEADAIAAARAVRRSVIDRVCADAGYVKQETRGRKEVSRQLTIELKVSVEPEAFFVQKNSPNSAQNGNPNSYKAENASAQKSASLSGSPVVLRVSTVSEEPVVIETPDTDPSPPAPLTSEATKVTQAKPAESDAPGAVSGWVETQFEHRIDGKLRAQFDELPTQFGIPTRSVIRFLHDKMEAKKGADYTVSNPGALYKFTRKDLPAWIKQNRSRFHTDLEIERAEQRARAAPSPPSDEEPFDPVEFNKLMDKTRMPGKGKGAAS